MSNKITSEEQGKMLPTDKIFKDLSKGLRLSAVYFPEGGKKKVFYCIYFLLLTINDILWLLRQLYVMKDGHSLTLTLLTAGITVYDTGVTFMAIGCCYGITNYFPQLIATLEAYRICFGELRCLTRLRYFLKFGYLLFCIFTPILVFLLQGSFVVANLWSDLKFTFWPFQIDTFNQRLVFVIYATPKSLRTGGILILVANLFMAICYIIKTESEVIEKRIKSLVCYPPKSSKAPLYVQDLDTISKAVDRYKHIDLNSKPNQENSPGSHFNTINNPNNSKTTQLHETRRFYVKDISATEEDELELLRHRYEALLDLVSITNDVLVNFFLTAFATSLPVLGFVLYGVIKGDINHSMMIYLAIITMNVTSAMCWVLFISSYTSVKIKKPLDHVMKINAKTASNKLILTMSLLTRRLTLPASGFNVYQLFSIDTTAVVTIFGTLLTYSLVIFQFAQGSENRTDILRGNITQIQ